MTDVGIFRTTITVEPLDRSERRTIRDAIVDTGSEYSWLPAQILTELRIQRLRVQRFRLADGRVIERDVGYAILHAGGTEAPDIVVFAAPTDAVILGAHSIEGMNLRLDLASRQLLPAGPIITAAA